MDLSKLANKLKQNHKRSSSFPSEPAIDSNRKTNWQKSPREPISIAHQADVSHYPLNRGRCLILNYEKFLNKYQNKRDGSERDVCVLKQTFKDFGFDVETQKDLTASATLKALKNERDQSKSYDCFVLCLLSHGGEMETIFCHDKGLSLNKIFNIFSPKNCASLAGKPKLFFIQACRGNLVDHGTLVADGPSPSVSNHFSIPAYEDLLIFYSTYPGYYSFRSGQNGSWFVQDLCQVLRDNAKQFDLMSMLTLTCGKVAIERKSNVPGDIELHEKKQMPCIVSTLTRSIHFDAKY